MRVAIAGILLESSSFTRDVTPAERFTVMRGDEILADYNWVARFSDLGEDVEPDPILIAAVIAGGPMTAEAFDGFTTEIIEALESRGPFDGVYLHMHGAMSVIGQTGAEEQFVARVRRTVGPGPIIGMSMDPHGNLSEQLAAEVDLAASHRHSPHIDRWTTRERVVRQIVDVIRRGERPLKAWVRVPVLLPGERTSTVVEPGKTVFGSIEPAIERFGVLDANIWIGFYWADEPRNTASVLVTGYDQEAVTECAAHLARLYWNTREDFVIVSEHFGPWEDALDYALSGAPPPLWISDSGDNVTAGGTGDITFALHAMRARADVLASRKNFLFAGLVDAPTVDAAIQAGPGSVLDRPIGAVVDDRFGGPVPGSWRIERLIEGKLGEGIVAAVLRDGPITVSVQSHRVYFVSSTDLGSTGFNIPGAAYFDPVDYDVIVVKNGYLFPDQAAQAASAFMAITPGGTDLDPERLRWQAVQRPLFPLDRGFDAELTPRMLRVGVSRKVPASERNATLMLFGWNRRFRRNRTEFYDGHRAPEC